jgi:predicted phosphodiesterase
MAGKPKIRKCEQCDLPYEPKTSSSRFCSESCRWDFHNKRGPSISRNRKETNYGWMPPIAPEIPRVKAPKRTAPISKYRGIGGKWKTAVIVPDPQIGFRVNPDTLERDPFHDLNAINIVEQVIEGERPDLVVHLGDFLDLAPFGRFEQEPAFALSVQPALDYGVELLSKIGELTKKQVLIEGNHDARLHKGTINNLFMAAGIRPGKFASTEFPQLSVPALLRTQELGVEYVGAYPAGRYFINDNLAAIHGHVVKPAGQTAAHLAEHERTSVIFGHIHRQELAHYTRGTHDGPKTNVAFSPGCVCRIDGAVPSVHSGTDVFGKPALNYENWQQGFAVVRYQEGDGAFKPELYLINDGITYYQDSVIKSRLRDAA